MLVGKMRFLIPVALLLAALGSAAASPQARAADTAPASIGAAPPARLSSDVIYTVYPSIASPTGDLKGITAQLPRLKRLGITILWLMPVTSLGKPVDGHPAFDSPYCVHDFYAINPAYGGPDDLKALVDTAHKQGIKVILDEVLNHSSWDNEFITKHPEFYIHSDGNPANPKSIVRAFTYNDVAQFDYSSPGLRAYMEQMLVYWLTEYHLDGFRFDTADDPFGANRRVPASFWQQAATRLRAADPNVILLGECEDPELAQKPFQIDYGWWLYDALKKASNAGGDAAGVVTWWNKQRNEFPAGMLHMTLQDDWDTPRDITTFGGPAGAMAAAVFNLTIDGVPLIYNGMEIGNAAGAVNPHAPIDWSKADPTFPALYHDLIALRERNLALQSGAVAWLTNSTPSQMLTYTRTAGRSQFLVVINLSNSPAAGEISGFAGGTWKNVTPGAAPRLTPANPNHYDLKAKGFAVYETAEHGN